ncbi:HEPN domain-containing protein [Nitrosomonas ureae]|uniref:Uncharacterized protein n=1 Tax=Nitrosomonas ureae TaxID=44577 RepID=A0A2T5IDN3_9PROT|nr:HEPN domain-containing protein [Nitrosomonas ureae]PTQ81936.1 hypothetical protein C8R28_10292 [Nitrosomonas ureae]
MFDIHPSARENFNIKANAFMQLIKKSPKINRNTVTANSEIHIAANITEKDIIGDLKESISDYRGNVVGRIFYLNNERYALEGDDYQELLKLAESIQRISVFREKLSQGFIEEKIFFWLEQRFKIHGEYKNFTDFLCDEATDIVKPITVRVPIASTAVQEPFQFCNAIIKNYSKDMIDKMAPNPKNFKNKDHIKYAEQHLLKFRKEYQGYAIVELQLECEPDYAKDFSLNETKRITDLLGIYSGAQIIPDIKCVSKAKGTENLETYNLVIDFGEDNSSISSGLLDVGSSQVWRISKEDIKRFNTCGLSLISEIATKTNPTEFESTVLNMAFIYSKAAFTSDPLEKLVYMLSALESTLLKSVNEPIQQNIAERLAFFISKELTERKAIVKNFRSVYEFRSKYLHHGHSSTELGELAMFFKNVWVFYVSLVKNSGRFDKKIEFLDAIDDCKLS